MGPKSKKKNKKKTATKKKKVSNKRSNIKQSPYKGVHWNGRIWLAQKNGYIGQFESDLEAAKAVNWKCKQMGVAKLNKGVGAKKPPATKPKKKTATKKARK